MNLEIEHGAMKSIFLNQQKYNETGCECVVRQLSNLQYNQQLKNNSLLYFPSFTYPFGAGSGDINSGSGNGRGHSQKARNNIPNLLQLTKDFAQNNKY